MKIEHKTIQMKQTRYVYIAEDGQEFSVERDCRQHESLLRQDALKLRKDIIYCSEGKDFPPFNGGENYERHEYRWYKPTTQEAVDALREAYPSYICANIDESGVGKWCCVEMIADGDYYWTCLEDDIRYVERLCRALGTEVAFEGNATMRENLIATMARRAGNMEMKGCIDIGGTVQDEDRFADFCTETVDAYRQAVNDGTWDWSFDEFIETALEKRYKSKQS